MAVEITVGNNSDAERHVQTGYNGMNVTDGLYPLRRIDLTEGVGIQ